MGKPHNAGNGPEAPTLLGELDRYVAALDVVQQRICGALAAGRETTLRLVVKTDRGKIVSIRLEANDDLLAADQTATAAV